MFKAEHAADMIKDDIRRTIPKRFFLPVYRGDLLGYVKLQDDMADSVEDIAVLLTIKKLTLPPSLVDLTFDFRNLGIDFVSFQENIDTASPLGSAIFTIISAVAQLERDIIASRVRAGLRRARENGKTLGRPRIAVDANRIAVLRAQGRSWAKISELLGIGKGTAQRAFYSLPKNPSGKPPVSD